MTIDVNDYLIDQTGIDWNKILSNWQWILPKNFTLWLVNRFGDLFIKTKDGSIHLLDVGNGTLDLVAKNANNFCDLIDQDNMADEWLLKYLVDDCVKSGMTLGKNECYSFKHPPGLSGEYSASNVDVCDIAVHYSISGQVFFQIKDLPEGTIIDTVEEMDG